MSGDPIGLVADALDEAKKQEAREYSHSLSIDVVNAINSASARRFCFQQRLFVVFLPVRM